VYARDDLLPRVTALRVADDFGLVQNFRHDVRLARVHAVARHARLDPQDFERVEARRPRARLRECAPQRLGVGGFDEEVEAVLRRVRRAHGRDVRALKRRDGKAPARRLRGFLAEHGADELARTRALH
jgi:hypothetical protein